MARRGLLLLLLLLVVVGVLAAACGSSGGEPGTEAPSAATPADAAPSEDGEPTPAADATTPTEAPTPTEGTDATVPTEVPEPTAADTAADPPAVAEDSAAFVDPAAQNYDFGDVGPVVEAFVADNGLDGAGLIVVHADDGVIFHDHWGAFDEDRISLVASSSKMITAGVLLHLDDQGLLDIDQPVAAVAEWGAGNPDITPAQLISNSSGLVGLLPDPTYGPYLCQFLAGGTLQECAATIMTTDGDDADVAAPDTRFDYGGAQWQVAGAVAEVVSGKSWSRLIDEIYVQPCGLETLAYNNHFTQLGPGGFDYPTAFDGDPDTLQATDNPNMEGGAYVTTGDYGKLLLMHLRDGMCGDTQVLSPDALATMHGDRIARVYDGDAWSPGRGYGMGWWVDRSTGRITDAGAYGSVPWLDLEDGYGAFLVIEANGGLGDELAGSLYDLVEAAVVG